MPKRKKPFDQAEQSKQFAKVAQELIDAGELSLTDAERALDDVVKRARRAEPTDNDEPHPD